MKGYLCELCMDEMTSHVTSAWDGLETAVCEGCLAPDEGDPCWDTLRVQPCVQVRGVWKGEEHLLSGEYPLLVIAPNRRVFEYYASQHGFAIGDERRGIIRDIRDVRQLRGYVEPFVVVLEAAWVDSALLDAAMSMGARDASTGNRYHPLS